jgi:predicted ATPase/class 3 adenylate cyclase
MSTPLRLPTGTVTFLFTDIEGSTALWGRAPQAMNVALAAHDALFREVVPAHNGTIFKTVGDAICAAFARADDAIAAAIEAQRRLAAQPWPEETGPIRVRMGIHTGQAIERDDDYFGPALNRVARIQGIAHGGQVLVTRATASVVEGMLDPSIRLRDLGVHHLKGLTEPETALQIVAPGLELDFPPLTSSDHHPSNIPAPISSFVGRTRELAELAELTRFHRLVTIAGTGGIGKTRISQRLAESVLDDFPDGAWIVELATIGDPRLVAQTIGDVFALREDPQTSIDSRLLDHLVRKKLLLVLDNAEHLLAATAELAKKLLAHCPDVVIVATSREPLHIVGEFVYRLPPLDLATRGPAGETPDLAEGVALFLERARAVQPRLRIDAGDDALVGRICAKLEGIPLAIELAAARSVLLSLLEIDERLARRFEILTSRDATREPRHRTLHGTIDWSYQLLSPQERAFARSLVVFEGGFTLASASAVAETPAAATLDLAESLVDKSLSNVQPSAAESRYALVDSVRDFLRQSVLESAEAARVRGRHLAYFSTFVRGSGDRSASGRAAWMQKITGEIANIRAALDWGILSATPAAAAMLVELSSYWVSQSYITEGEFQLRRFLELPGTGDQERAPLLRRASTFATIRGSYDDAYRLTREAGEAYERAGDAGGVAEALHNLGVIEHQIGNDAGAKRHYTEALLAFRIAEHARGELMSLLNLTLIALKNDDFVEAEELLATADPLAERLGDAGTQSYHIGLRGTLAFRRGEYDEAVRLYGEALAIKRRLGDRFDTAELLDRIAKATLKLGDRRSARATAAESLRIALELDAHVLIIRAFETFAELALVENDPGDARACFELARSLRDEHAYRHSVRDLEALDAEIARMPGGERRTGLALDHDGWREKAATLALLQP